MKSVRKHQDVWDWIMEQRENEIIEGRRQYIFWHYKRYFDSFVFLAPWLDGKNTLNILELGAGSEVVRFLLSCLKNSFHVSNLISTIRAVQTFGIHLHTSTDTSPMTLYYVWR